MSATSPAPVPPPLGAPGSLGRTARRIQWHFLPPGVRAQVEGRCGSPVVDAVSCDAGFTPGMASVLTCLDGSRHFVKAASGPAQGPFAESYRAEARTLRALAGSGVPAPALRWTLGVEGLDDADAEGWVLLGLEHVPHRLPGEPWTLPDLDRALDALATVTAARVVPADQPTLAEECAAWPALWRRSPAVDLPHAGPCAELAAHALDAAAGDHLVHLDLRGDNVLLADDGRTLLCDWTWPVRGAAWVDAVTLLAAARDDLPAAALEARLAEHPLTAGVAADDVDALLALLLGCLTTAGAGPVPTTSPWVRAAQRRQAGQLADWLRVRRGWSVDSI
ncbi:aminoglycoside phosphotransferase family protein [Nocardioides sp. TRM66260-LWL]|uniref:phosphotransferase n=1 Tax=Nocardioides sp. TRM66260-LWL TaxID=2874478 RepID=UPI001CC5F22E|nr:phosphotransferase [Nocardioides sp. TRM66260-LWL]MBZ5735877.1 aminoglycoside phosphotransferase family protein [Nocardioides sp. TRM66260-LWL]